MDEQPEVEQLKQQEEVRTALKQTAGTKETQPPEKPVAQIQDKLWFGTYILLLLGLGALYYVLSHNWLPIPQRYVLFADRALIGAMLMVAVVGLAKMIRIYWIGQIENRPAQYNLNRVLNLVRFLVLVIIGLSLLSTTWYTALVSLGIISLILGFALQTPITSFIGWIYLLIRQPYRVGDRIMLGDAKGDVIDVGYLDTTLWELGGPHLSTDHPSGRIIRFPNSLVLSETVYNYSWPLFPYVWNEIKFHVAYESDLAFIAQTMQQGVEEELGSEMVERVQLYRELLRQTPVDELDIKEHPVVHFRVSENTWIEVMVRYLTHPKEAGRIKTRLTKQLLETLNAAPERVLFPKSNMR